ncbi:hypothetical protein AB0I10_33445 [Streptomyces sp. NPDC050636]
MDGRRMKARHLLVGAYPNTSLRPQRPSPKSHQTWRKEVFRG